MEVKINQGDEMLDATIEMVDGVMVVSPKEVKYMYKEGEVIFVRSIYKHILIYKKSTNGYLYSFADLIEGRLDIDDTPVCNECDITEIRPATEKEKKLLFDKLAEKGWEWKADTKELVKLKWKPKYKEPYFAPHFSNVDFLFLTCSHIYTEHFTDELTFKKTSVFKTEQECQEFCNRLNDAINSVNP